MKQTKQKLALALVFSALLLTGCSSYGDVETLLRAPQLSGGEQRTAKGAEQLPGRQRYPKIPGQR